MNLENSIDSSLSCDDNWIKLINEYDGLIGSVFIDKESGIEYTFFGLVHGVFDYYYGLYSDANGLVLLSCVLSLNKYGYIFKKARSK